MENITTQSFNINIQIMKILCLYSSEKRTRFRQVLRYIMHFLFTLCIPIMGSIHFIINGIDKDEMDIRIAALAEAACGAVKLLPFIMYESKIKECIHYFDSSTFMPYRKNQKMIMLKGIKICRRNSRYFLMAGVFGYGGWIIRPLFAQNYKQPIELWLPISVQKERVIYKVIIHFFIILGTFYPIIACTIIDPLIGGLACLATSHMKILKDNLEHLHLSEYSNKEITNNLDEKLYISKSEILYKNIKDCVEQYTSVLNFAKLYEACFSQVTFSQMGTSILIICICCLQFSLVKPTVINYTMATFNAIGTMAQIFFYCYYATTLYKESNTLTHAIYMGKWYDYDIISKKALIILMERSKKPIVITAGKILEISLVTFTTIMRRSYSLLAVLKSM